MSQSWSGARNVHWRWATQEQDGHSAAGKLFAPVNRFLPKFPRAATRSRRRIARAPRQPSYCVKPYFRSKVATLDCDWRFDRRMWIVACKFEIFEFETVDVFDFWIQFDAR